VSLLLDTHVVLWWLADDPELPWLILLMGACRYQGPRATR
jgi:hypothetical protein